MRASLPAGGPGKWSRKFRPLAEYYLHVAINGSKPIAGKVVRGADPDVVVAAAHAAEPALADQLPRGSRRDAIAAAAVGRALAERAAAEGVTGVRFEKPQGMRYQGRLAALVDAVRARVPLC